MGLKFLKWLLPIVLELVKPNGRYPGYFKRNKTITLLIIACLISIGVSLFMSEQAVIHGANSKINQSTAIELSEELEACVKEKETISNKVCS